MIQFGERAVSKDVYHICYGMAIDRFWGNRIRKEKEERETCSH